MVSGDTVAGHILVRRWAAFNGVEIWDGQDEVSKKIRTVVVLEQVGVLLDGTAQWGVRPDQFARGIALRREFEACSAELPDGELPKAWRRLHSVAPDQRAYVTERLDAEPLEAVCKLSIKRKVALAKHLEQLVGYFHARKVSISGLDASNLAVARNVDAFVVLDFSFMQPLDGGATERAPRSPSDPARTDASIAGRAVDSWPRTRRYLPPEVVYDDSAPTIRGDVFVVARLLQHVFNEKAPEPASPSVVLLEGCSSRSAPYALAHALDLDPLSRPATVSELFAEIRGKRPIPGSKRAGFGRRWKTMSTQERVAWLSVIAAVITATTGVAIKTWDWLSGNDANRSHADHRQSDRPGLLDGDLKDVRVGRAREPE